MSSKLTNLLAGNQVADLTTVGLNRSCGSFNSDCLLRVSYLQTEVDTRPVSHRKHQARLLRNLEARRGRAN